MDAYLGVLVTSIRILGSKRSAIDDQPPVVVESKISRRFPRTTDRYKPFVAGITEQIVLAIRLCTIFVSSWSTKMQITASLNDDSSTSIPFSSIIFQDTKRRATTIEDILASRSNFRNIGNYYNYSLIQRIRYESEKRTNERFYGKSRDLFSVTKNSEEHVFVVAVGHDCSRAYS